MIDIASQIERLASLMERGLITREEFDQQKQQLLLDQARTEASVTDPGRDVDTLMQSGDAFLASGAPLSPTDTASSIGPYQVLEKIGEGGMGVVYRARHRSEAFASRQGGDVAVKVLHAQYCNRPDIMNRFEQEAALGIELEHPGIVRVHELIMDGGRVALVMELVEGRMLSEMIGMETGPIPWQRAAPLLSQLLSAIRYAHAHGVVHRDLKPDNMIISPSGKLKILDFGIAKVDKSGRTQTGTGMGTVDYMAPEQYTNAQSVDRRADVYALGMTLYEMLAGRLPWEENTTEFEVLKRKECGDFPPPTEFYPYIPEQLVAVIGVATDPDPNRRFSKISLIQDLVSCLPGTLEVSEHALQEPLLDEPGSPKPRKQSGTSRRSLVTPSSKQMRAIQRGTWALLGAHGIVLMGLLPTFVRGRTRSRWSINWFPDGHTSDSTAILYALNHLTEVILGFVLIAAVRRREGYQGLRPLWNALACLGLFYAIRDPLLLRGDLGDVELGHLVPAVQIGFLALMGVAYRLNDLPGRYRTALAVLGGLMVVGGVPVLDQDEVTGGIYVCLGIGSMVYGLQKFRFGRVESLVALGIVLLVVGALQPISPELGRVRSEFPFLPQLLRALEVLVPVLAPWALGTAVTQNKSVQAQNQS